MFLGIVFLQLAKGPPNRSWGEESIPSDLGGLEGIDLSGILTNRLLAEES